MSFAEFLEKLGNTPKSVPEYYKSESEKVAFVFGVDKGHDDFKKILGEWANLKRRLYRIEVEKDLETGYTNTCIELADVYCDFVFGCFGLSLAQDKIIEIDKLNEEEVKKRLKELEK